MSYCIDGETPYWGGLEVPCHGRIPTSFDVKDWKKSQEDALKSVADGVEDYIREEIARELSNSLEESRKVYKEWDETMSKLREKPEQMEKKKNKMTRAEAFEWLKCKKIDAWGYLEKVQEKLFSLGITWVLGGTTVAHHGIYIFINGEGELTHGGCDKTFWERHCYEEIKAHDILSLEIEEEYNYSQFETMTNEPCDEIKAVQELLRNSKHLKDKIIVITKDNAAIL